MGIKRSWPKWISRFWKRRNTKDRQLQALIEEDGYPRDEMGAPDLRYFKKALNDYIEMYEGYLEALTLMDKGVLLDDPSLAIRQGTYAVWGLIAKGSEAIPYVLTLLKHRESEARSAGASILGALGENDGVVDELLRQLQIENDQEARDSLIFALGRLENKKAIPLLATIIQKPETDDETRWLAMESLGEIVHKRFTRQEDAMAAARSWLEKNGFSES